MASPTVNVGTGTSVTFGSEFDPTPALTVYELTNISLTGITRGEVESTHLDTDASPNDFAGRTWKPTSIVQCGQVVLEGHLNPDITPPIENSAVALTIDWAGGAVWSATGAMVQNFDWTDPFDDKMGFVCTAQITEGWKITSG